MMGAPGFGLSEDERSEMKTALEVAHGNKDDSLGLKLRSVFEAGEGRRQREVAAAFNVPLRAFELGFSVQYHRQKLPQADKDRQATWLREELPPIKKSPRGRWRPDVRGRGSILPIGLHLPALGEERYRIGG
jgi:hypothetical protein